MKLEDVKKGGADLDIEALVTTMVAHKQFYSEKNPDTGMVGVKQRMSKVPVRNALLSGENLEMVIKSYQSIVWKEMPPNSAFKFYCIIRGHRYYANAIPKRDKGEPRGNTTPKGEDAGVPVVVKGSDGGRELYTPPLSIEKPVPGYNPDGDESS